MRFKTKKFGDVRVIEPYVVTDKLVLYYCTWSNVNKVATKMTRKGLSEDLELSYEHVS